MSNNILHIHSIECDFKKHRGAVYQFADRMTAIRGPNGAGKSSILHAILFALYGVSAVPGGKAVAIPTGAKDASVMLSFSLGDSQFEIERTTGGARLYQVEGKERSLKANGTTAVTDFVKDSLGIASHQEFARFSYSPQGQTAALLTLGAPMLNKVVEQLAGADFIDRIVNRAKTRITSCNGQLSALPAPIDIGPFKKEVTDARQRMDTIESDFPAAEEAVNGVTEALSATRVHYDAVVRDNKRNRELREVRANLTKDIENGSANLAQLILHLEEIGPDEYEQKAARLDAAKDRAIAVRDRWSRYSSLLRDKSRSEEVISSLSEKVKETEKIKVEVEELLQKIRKEEEQHKELETAINERKASIKNIENALEESVCPACGRAYEEGQREKIEADLARENEKLKELEPVYNGVCQSLGAKQRAKLLLEQKMLSTYEQAQLVGAEETVKACNAGLEEVGEVTQEEVKELDDIYTEALQELGQAKQLKQQREKLEYEISQLKPRIEYFQLQLIKIGTIPEDVDEMPIRAKEEEYMALLAEKHKVVASLQTEYTQLENRVNLLSHTIEEQEKATETRKELEKKVTNYTLLSKYLVQNKARYLADIWAGITATVTEFVSSVTDGAINSVTRDESGDFWFTEGDETRPMVAASGGQAAIAGVGMRLAMGSLQPAGAGLLLLDEPSGELSDETASALAGALLGQDRQIIMVTHRLAEEFSAEKTIVLGEM